MSIFQKIAGKVIAIGSGLAPNLFARIIVPGLLMPRRVPAQSTATLERIDIDDGLVAWQENDSDPTRPLALFVHGFNGNHAQWSAIAKVVREAGYRLIFLDPPGHGASRRGQCDPIIFGNAVRTAFEYLGPVSLCVGHSMGAIAGVLGTRDVPGADAYMLMACPVVMANTIKATAQKVGIGTVATDAILNEVGRRVGAHPSDLDLTQLIATESAPALMVHDRGDGQVPFGEAERLHASWPNAHLFATSGLGHNRILQDGEVLAEIVQFLSSLDWGDWGPLRRRLE